MYIIDGYNLIGKLNNLANPNKEDELICLIKKFCFEKNKKAMIVFDGTILNNNEFGPVKVKYSSYDLSADEYIMQIISSKKNPKNLIIISSDNQIINFAKKYYCKTILSENFINKLQDNKKLNKKTNISLSKTQIDDWLKYFKKN